MERMLSAACACAWTSIARRIGTNAPGLNVYGHRLDVWATFERMPPFTIMGVVNVTPDSFSDGGTFSDAVSAIVHARRLAGEGAAIIDVGGESTRPGAAPVPVEQELERVIPVIEGVAGLNLPVQISIDTMKLQV